MKKIKLLSITLFLTLGIAISNIGILASGQDYPSKQNIKIENRSFIQKAIFDLPLDITRLEIADAKNQPQRYILETILTDTLEIAKSSDTVLTDKNPATYKDLTNENEALSKYSLDITLSKISKIQGLQFNLDIQSASPTYINVFKKDIISNTKTKIFAGQLPSSNKVNFPEFELTDLLVEIEYNKPVRILDIDLYGNNTKVSGRKVTFLALPSTQYKLFLDTSPAQYLASSVNSGTVTASDAPTKQAQLEEKIANPDYKPSDKDSDGIEDANDNCPSIKNSDQKDLNQNQKGDACEDSDGDRVLDYIDNCILEVNSDQKDTDNDKKGDICDKIDDRFLAGQDWIIWVSLVIGFAAVGTGSYFVIAKKS